MIRLGSHCSMKAPKFIEGSVKEALSYGANALMIYTGPPQNTLRKPVEALHIEEAKTLMEAHNIPMEAMVVHAPYIINLANSVNPSTFDLAKSFLRQELDRVKAIGAKYLVLHPGSFTTATKEAGVQYIINGLNEILLEDEGVIICLETMAGKGSEIGCDFETLRYIIDHVNYNNNLGICMDTCHLNDAGYDINNIDQVLDDIDSIIGLDRVHVVHVNDSKNVLGARKDRHENIGKGTIGFEALYNVVHHPRLAHTIKILETPYIDGNPPYKEEIEGLLNNQRIYE